MTKKNTLTLKQALDLWKEDDCGLDKVVLEAFKSRKLIFFLGAGVSRIEGVMGWDDFANLLIKKAFPSLKDQAELLNNGLSSKEKITIAYGKFHDNRQDKKFYKEFGKALRAYLPKDRVGIYETLSKFNVNFLTTNADSLFEDVLGKNCCHSDYDQIKLFNPNHYPNKQLFYLHGRYADGLESLVFTAPQYVKRYNDKKFLDFIKKIFSEEGYVIFFIGYGLNEYELIDYMMTKANVLDNDSQRRIFILEPFFSNQEVLFEARRKYFDELNIKLIPYSKDNGYQELKKYLDKLLNVFENQIVYPHIDYQDIKDYLADKYTPQHDQEVNYILEKNMSHGALKVACDTLKSSKYCFEWSENIVNNQFWFPDYDAKEYLGWNENAYSRSTLLSYLLCREDTYDIFATKVKQILENIFREEVNVLKDSRFSVLYNYINIICLLKDQLVDDICFSLVEIFFGICGISFVTIGFEQPNKIQEWSDKKIEKLIFCIHKGIKEINLLDEYHATKLETIFANVNIQYNYRIANAFFNGIYKFVEQVIDRPDYCGVHVVSNFDNLKKAHEYGLVYLFGRLVFYFGQMSENSKDELLHKGLNSKNEWICKLWIYVLRKTKNDLKFITKYETSCFSYESCICELYLLIMHSDLQNYRRELRNLIKQSNFGLDDTNSTIEYRNRIKNAFLKIIGDNIESDYEDIVAMADKLDYFHFYSEDWIDKSDISVDSIIEELKRMSTQIRIAQLASNLVEKLSVLSFKDMEKYLKIIEELDDEKLNMVLLYFSLEIKNLVQEKQKIVYECALKVLLSDKNHVLLLKNCFMLLAKSELVNFYNVFKDELCKCWEKWNKKSLDYHCKLTLGNDFVNELINTAEYAKISFFCNYWIARRHVDNISLSKDEVEMLVLISKDNIVKWCLAQRFEYVCKDIKEDNLRKYFVNSLVYMDNNSYDYVTLFLIIVSSQGIFNHVVDLLRESKLLEKIVILQRFDDISLQSFYNYVTYLYYFNMIPIKEISPLFDKKEFYQAAFLYIYRGFEEDDNRYIVKFTGELWSNAKGAILNNDVLLTEISSRILTTINHSLNGHFDSDLMKIAIQLLEHCKKGIIEWYPDSENLIKIYCEGNEDGKKYIKLLFVKIRKFSYLNKVLEELVKYFSINDSKFAQELIRELYNEKKITLEVYGKLYDISQGKTDFNV